MEAKPCSNDHSSVAIKCRVFFLSFLPLLPNLWPKLATECGALYWTMLSTVPMSIPNSNVDVQHIVNKSPLLFLAKFSAFSLISLLTEA